MAKAWYPVIDYAACLECGSCVAMCPHGVYDQLKAPTPVVKNPDGCVDHCHGCGNRCPVGAITYVGDDTGWTPPNGKTQEAAGSCCDCGGDEEAQEEPETCGCGCGCGGDEEAQEEPETCGCGCDTEKTVAVEYLYLDLNTCDRCLGTDKELDEVMKALTPALALAGFEVAYNKIEMATAEIAKQYRFLSSPTIRVNGRDIFGSVSENSCGCCGEISGTDVNCRVFEYGGQSFEVPPKELLANAILSAVFNGSGAGCACGDYELPENLKTFYEGKSRKACSCGGNCC